eukprot:scaffold138084_cov14-Prasinocladus_malaysianus.AAC.1
MGISGNPAEREAWKIAEAEQLDLVTICPNFIMGPVISRRVDGTSVGWLKAVMEKAAPDNCPILCDVRDVAAAHILAAETPSAKGSCCNTQCASNAALDTSVGTIGQATFCVGLYYYLRRASHVSDQFTRQHMFGSE